MEDELAEYDLLPGPVEQRAALRADLEEVVRNAYRAGWEESRRWPNHPKPPHVELEWGHADGIHIREDHTRRMSAACEEG